MITKLFSISLICVVLTATSPAVSQNIQFSPITDGDIVSDSGNSGGGSWGDYDNDGDIDLFVAYDDGENNRLYQNNGDGTFTKILTGDIVNDGGDSRMGSWGDYDNDRYLDIFVANANGQNNFLYKNNGNGTFTKITSGAIINDGGNCQGTSWGDFDDDGYLDLFVSNYSGPNFIYKNNGNGTFTRLVDGDIANDTRNASSGNWVDFDNDGDVDLFVLNGDDQNNSLYSNNGDGTFNKITTGDIVNDGGHSAAACWGDYDNDGDVDLFVINIHEDFFYQNNGNGSFTRILRDAEIVNTGTGGMAGSWGDYDNDGDLDLIVVYPDAILYQNEGNRNFIKSTIAHHTGSVGISSGDYNNDGALDFFISHRPQDYLYLNEKNNTNNWINIKLVGKQSNTAAIGAKLHIIASINGTEVHQMRELYGATSYRDQNSLNAEFGLGDATIINKIEIEWPSGKVQQLFNVQVNQFTTIIEESEVDLISDIWNDIKKDGESIISQEYTIDVLPIRNFFEIQGIWDVIEISAFLVNFPYLMKKTSNEIIRHALKETVNNGLLRVLQDTEARAQWYWGISNDEWNLPIIVNISTPHPAPQLGIPYRMTGVVRKTSGFYYFEITDESFEKLEINTIPKYDNPQYSIPSDYSFLSVPDFASYRAAPGSKIHTIGIVNERWNANGSTYISLLQFNGWFDSKQPVIVRLPLSLKNPPAIPSVISVYGKIIDPTQQSYPEFSLKESAVKIGCICLLELTTLALVIDKDSLKDSYSFSNFYK